MKYEGYRPWSDSMSMGHLDVTGSSISIGLPCRTIDSGSLPSFTWNEALDETARGQGGFGSTGVR